MNKIRFLLFFLLFSNTNIFFCVEDLCAKKSVATLKKNIDHKAELEKMRVLLQDLDKKRKLLRQEILTQEKAQGEVPEGLNVKLWKLINEINDVKGNIFRLQQIVYKEI